MRGSAARSGQRAGAGADGSAKQRPAKDWPARDRRDSGARARPDQSAG